MTNEELAIAIQQGETDRLPELWNGIERLVKWKANRIIAVLDVYSDLTTGVQFDDLYDSGYLVLADAVRTFKPEAGGTFSNWYMFYLKKAFAEVTGYRTKKRSCDPLRNAISLDAPIKGMDDKDGCTLGDTIADKTDYAEMVTNNIQKRDLEKVVAAALTELSEQEEQVIRAEFYKRKNSQQIGEILGISPSRVCQLRASALRKLRESKIADSLRPFLEDEQEKANGVASWKNSRAVKDCTSLAEQLALIRLQILQKT